MSPQSDMMLMVEQPLNWDDSHAHAKLQEQIETTICLDECIHNSRHVASAIELRACRIINIKLGRVGGHTEAKAVEDRHYRAGSRGHPAGHDTSTYGSWAWIPRSSRAYRETHSPGSIVSSE
jgi:L-alanine-DL-glutamate epimerase-like enolase superfamily enzyme